MGKWTVSRAADHWLKWREATSGSRRTLQKDRAVLRSLKKELGGKRLDAITNWVLDSHQAKRAKEIGPAQVNREIRYLAILLRKAKLWNRLRDDYRPLKANKEVSARALTAEQVRFLLNVSSAKKEWTTLGLCATIAVNTGLRGGELKQITLGRIEKDPPALWVGRGTTKTDAGARRVPLNAMAQWALDQLLFRAGALGVSEPEHYLLPRCLGRHTKTGDPMHGKRGYDPTLPQESLRSAWESLCSEAATRWAQQYPQSKDSPFRGLRFHDLRHTFITHCGIAGIPIERVMAMVGHMASEMTRHYLHLRDVTLRTVVDRVQDSLAMAPPAASAAPPALSA